LSKTTLPKERRIHSTLLRLGFLLLAVIGIGVAGCGFATIAKALKLPSLTGRVVDQAQILSQATKTRLGAKLEALESKSGIQFVVATVPSLGGRDIENYANDLFRKWKLGDVKKNDGVLLLIAPNERKVRIEVGYGLEGLLTDALCRIIISIAITPRFKDGDFDGGVARGVDDVINILAIDTSEWQKRPAVREDWTRHNPVVAFFGTLLALCFLALLDRFLRWLFGLTGSYGGGGSFGGGGGFSGGGGSSGGGGASGGW
jgi:uncharacterized protein